MSIFAELAQYAAEAQTHVGEPFQIEGDTTAHTGAMAESPSDAAARIAGYESVRELSIVVPKAQFTVAPESAARLRLTARNAKWVVTGCTADPLHYTLLCKIAD